LHREELDRDFLCKAGSNNNFLPILGLAPQTLCLRLLSRAKIHVLLGQSAQIRIYLLGKKSEVGFGEQGVVIAGQALGLDYFSNFFPTP